MSVSFVIPVYNEEATLADLTQGIMQYMPEERAYHILFIDDGITDNSLHVLEALQQEHPDLIDLIRVRRNCGKTHAYGVAFQHVQGDIVITMDADLQDDPREIPRMLEALESGLDLVCGWKKNRRDPLHKTLPSRVFNYTIAQLFGLSLHDTNTGFKAMRREVLSSIPLFGDMHRFIPVFVDNAGFRLGEIPVRHHPREHGESKYGLERFWRGAVDAVTAWFLTRHGNAPSHFFAQKGIAVWVLGILCVLLQLMGWLMGLEWMLTYPLLLVGALLCFFAGGLSFGMGFLGSLIAKSSSQQEIRRHDKVSDVQLGSALAKKAGGN